MGGVAALNLYVAVCAWLCRSFLVWLVVFDRAEVRGVGYGGSQNVWVDLGIGAGEFLEIGLDGYFDHTGFSAVT